jgi:hypothetical protein
VYFLLSKWKQKWLKEHFVGECTALLETEIWMLRGIRRGFGRGSCALCLGEEDAQHILLKCSGTKIWEDECVCSKMRTEHIKNYKLYKYNEIKKTLENIYSNLYANWRTELNEHNSR